MSKKNDSRLSLKSNFLIQLFDKDGNLKDERLIHNTVTTAGKNGVADQILASPTLTKIGWMAIGTGSPAANALGTEIERIAFDTLARSGAVDTIETYFGPGVGTGALTEAGTFDDVSAGNMWMSATFSVINKGASDSLQVTWTLTVS
jgi:hypothetical protein